MGERRRDGEGEQAICDDAEEEWVRDNDEVDDQEMDGSTQTTDIPHMR
jgi:hypothetical protein